MNKGNTVSMAFLERLETLCLRATSGDRVILKFDGSVTVFTVTREPFFDGRPESYDPGDSEPIVTFWDGKSGVIPKALEADTEIFSLLNPVALARMIDEIKWHRSIAKCKLCGKPAECYGKYADHDEGYACGECCGHGNEDGWCDFIPETKVIS